MTAPTIEPDTGEIQLPPLTLPTQRPAPARDRTTIDPEIVRLVGLAQHGDAEAFGLIYDRYLDTVFRFIYFRVGNRQLAEELTSDTFFRALNQIGSFTWQGRDFGAWLVTIARHRTCDHLRSGRHRFEVSAGAQPEPVDPLTRARLRDAHNTEKAAVDHVSNADLLATLENLTEEQRDCLINRFLLDLSVAETAAAMGKGEAAVKALTYRATRALRRLLDAMGFTR